MLGAVNISECRFAVYGRVFVFLILFLGLPLSASATLVEADCPFCLYTEEPEGHPLLANLPDIKIDDRFEKPTIPPWEKGSPGEEENLFTPEIENAPSPLPFVYNHDVADQIRFFQDPYREPMLRALTRSGKYMGLMKEIFEAYNLPKDLVYLPLLESGFSVNAVSRVKAVGLWQFMRATARRYGLRVDSWIDERRDPIKSTRAAAAYIKDLYAMFGSWWLALASYNVGENRIAKAIVKTQTKDFWELKLSGTLPRETQNFVPKYLAVTMIAKDPEKYGFPFPSYESPFNYDEVIINRPTSLHTIAQAMHLSTAELEALNPELRRGTTPPNYSNYRLRLPPQTKEVFMANRAKLKGPYRHRIRRGETLGTIAKQYRVSMTELIRENRLHKKSIIHTGQFLIIPNV